MRWILARRVTVSVAVVAVIVVVAAVVVAAARGLHARTRPGANVQATVGPPPVAGQSLVAPSLPICPPSSASPTSLAIVLNNTTKTFSQPCYYLKSGVKVDVTLTDQIANNETGLPVPYSVAISPENDPAFKVINDGNASSTTSPGPQDTEDPAAHIGPGTGGTVAPGNIVGSVQAALANTPTAVDATPVSAKLRPLKAGIYVLQLVPPSRYTTALLTVR